MSMPLGTGREPQDRRSTAWSVRPGRGRCQGRPGSGNRPGRDRRPPAPRTTRALYAQYILGARNGLLVAPAAPSLVSLYGRAAAGWQRRSSSASRKSGKSPDVVAVLAESRRQGRLPSPCTNDPASELAAAAEYLVELEAGEERAVAATKTYLAEIARHRHAVGRSLLGDQKSQDELRAVPAALQAAVEQEAVVIPIAPAWARRTRCAVLARGFHYATAREWALKLKELAYVLADPYSAATSSTAQSR